MEAVATDNPLVFNSRLETGIRALVVLDAIHPRACGLAELTWFDYLVVHSGDLGGPQSLHPDLPGQAGELLVRRRLVEESLALMQRVHLVDIVHTDAGIGFVSTEDAPSFVDLLESDYNQALKRRARWVAVQFQSVPTEQIEGQVRERVDRWNAEFLSGSLPTEVRT